MDEERVPVVVGVGTYTHPKASTAIPSPLDLLTEAVDRSVHDLNISQPAARALLADADCFGTVNLGPIGIPSMAGGDHKFRNLYNNPPLTVCCPHLLPAAAMSSVCTAGQSVQRAARW